MKELLYLFLYPLLCIVDEVKKPFVIRKFWDEWERESFEHKGYRINRSLYKIINGELVSKGEK